MLTVEVVCVARYGGAVRYQQGVKGCEMTILTVANHEQNIVITSLSSILTDTFRFEAEILISIDLNKIWSEACVLIPGTEGADGGRAEREGVGQRSLSAALASLDQLQSILHQVCNKSEGMCHLPPRPTVTETAQIKA